MKVEAKWRGKKVKENVQEHRNTQEEREDGEGKIVEGKGGRMECGNNTDNSV